MDSDGEIVDEERSPKDVSEEEAVKLYTDMLTGSLHPVRALYGWWEEGERGDVTLGTF